MPDAPLPLRKRPAFAALPSLTSLQPVANLVDPVDGHVEVVEAVEALS